MPSGGASFLPLLLMVGALGAMSYFMMRKQKRQVAATRALQDSITPGTRVMTTSGLHGTVTAMADDTIELEISPGVRTTWVRAAVREVVVAVPTGPDPDLTDADQALLDTDPVVEHPVTLEKRSGDLN